jgi:flagellar protein FlaF
MYQNSYSEILGEDPRQARMIERQALMRSIELLKLAQAAGPDTPETREALMFLTRMWVIFIEDLSAPANILPEQLRADIISVGVWLIKEAEAVRLGGSTNFTGLIEVSEAIMNGLA